MNWLRSKKIIATHDTNFHADDIFGVATLSILFNKRIKIIRTRDEKMYSGADFVLDVGQTYDPKKNLFDHHQTGGAGTRVNGIPYATFGLVWKEFGDRLSGSKEAAEFVDQKLVQIIDATDNGFDISKPIIEGVEQYTISDYIAHLNALCKKSERDKIFKRLVAFAVEIIELEIKTAKEFLHGQEMIRKAYLEATDKRLIVLDEDYDGWSTLSNYPEPLIVVKPSDASNAWKVYSVVMKGEKYKKRKNLPTGWGGKKDGDLAKITGVPDAFFCHHKLFMAAAYSKEGAIKLAKLALEQK